uniref:Ig-like domain-containing protein n=1 Tax=Schistosoma curassoni TaxID=6186 RepID=A0A183JQQ3_9TREM
LFHVLLKNIWEEEQVPQTDWEKRQPINIPKSEDLSKCDNYRGVTPLSVLRKVYNSVAKPVDRFSRRPTSRTGKANPPTVHVQPKVTVNEGEALEIACRVDANPVASSIYWTYNKFPDQTNIRDQPNLHWFQSKRIDGSVLKIPYTYPYHSGQYYCHADAEIYMPQDLWLSQNLSTSSEVWSIWQRRSRSFAAVNLTINCESRIPLVISLP